MNSQAHPRSRRCLPPLAAAAAGARAGSRRAAPTPAGFYGGVALRNAGVRRGRRQPRAPRVRVHVGPLRVAGQRRHGESRAASYGGYRFANDVAVEGSFATADRYALQPLDAAAPRGVGLSLGTTPAASRRADLECRRLHELVVPQERVALYGRLGYAQSDSVPAYALATLPISDARRLRDGMNYGVGVRYDISPALGLRLEYARFSRFAGEAVTGPLPESDQVQLGMQFRF